MIDKKEEVVEISKETLRMSEISLWIDTYDDIFSDFDPRPYSQRSLSDDFLIEAKKASKDKESGNIELKFLVPKNIRNLNQEAVIKKRLRDHFKTHFLEKEKEYNVIFRQGIKFILSGIFFMILTTFLLVKKESVLTTFFSVLFEPAGWFLFWEGLNLVIFESKKKKPDYEFYEKMRKVEIYFLDY